MPTLLANCPICGAFTPHSLLRAATAVSPPMVHCTICSTMWELLQDGTPRSEFEKGETAIYYERDFQGEVVTIIGDAIAAANAGFFPLRLIEGVDRTRRSVWGRYLRPVSGNTFVSHFADFLDFLSRDPQFVRGGWKLHNNPIALRSLNEEFGRVLVPCSSDVWVANIGDLSVSVSGAQLPHEAMHRLSIALRQSPEYQIPCATASLLD